MFGFVGGWLKSQALKLAISALIITVPAAGYLLHAYNKAKVEVAQATATAKANLRAVNYLSGQIGLRDKVAEELRHEVQQTADAKAAANAQLEVMKRENATLRQYMASYIPRPAACWLWGTSAGSCSQAGQTTAARLSIAAHTGAFDPYSAVTHEVGWKWAKALRAALVSCNSDKALFLKAVGGGND